jgi:hypothetical protein
MSVNISPVGGAGWQFFSNAGVPLSGGLLYTYEAGTTTPAATFTTIAGNVNHTNPIVLDSAGRVPSGGEIWLTVSQDYKFVLKTSAGVTIATWDNVQNYVGAVNVLFTPGANSLLSSTDVEDALNDLSNENSGSTFVGYLLGKTGAVKSTVAGKLARYIDVKDFGAVGDGVANDTAAIQAAVDAAYTNYNKTVHVPNGIYKLTDLITIKQGVMIDCEGSQGTNEAYGTVFKHYSNNSCFRWDGSGAQYTGTGGGLKNCLIVKADTYSGGNAIEVINQSDTNRCGEMVFENVLAYGLSSGRWTRGFVFDGTLTNTPGARGIRTVHMIKCRAADVTTANETVVLNQVTHFYAHGLAVDTGSGSAAGITMKGINDGVYLNALGCAGTFTIVANDANNSTDNLTIDGKVGGSFTNNDTAVNGTVSLGTTGGIANKSKNLAFLLGKKPGAFVTITSSISNVTGDGTKYQIAFNSTSFDPYTNWGGAAFNVTVAGRYKVTLCVGLFDVDAAHTRADLEIARTGTSTPAAWDTVNNPYAMSAPSGASRFSSMILETTMECLYGDVITPYITVSNGTKVVDVFGAATSYSYIAVEYLG